MDISPILVFTITQNVSNQSNSFLVTVQAILKLFSQMKIILSQDDAKTMFRPFERVSKLAMLPMKVDL